MQYDKDFLRVSLQVAASSYQKGNLPFGCILTDNAGDIVKEGENTVVTHKQPDVCRFIFDQNVCHDTQSKSVSNRVCAAAKPQTEKQIMLNKISDFA